MEYSKESSIICLGDTKQAALYFDRIFPISFWYNEVLCNTDMLEAFWEPILLLDRQDENEIKIKLPKIVEDLFLIFSNSDVGKFNFAILDNLFGLKKPHIIKEFVVPIFHLLFNYLEFSLLIWMKYKRGKMELLPNEVIEQFKMLDEVIGDFKTISNFHKFFNICVELLGLFYVSNFLKIEGTTRTYRSDIDTISKKWSGRSGQIILPERLLLTNDATESDISLTLNNMRLIDTSKSSWEQILEIRKSEEAKAKLRNLRLFFHTNYTGKNFNYIEDDLNKRLDEYHNTCRDWGFETVSTVISVILDSKSVISLLAGSAFGLLIGGQDIALYSGASIEVGSVALTIAKRKHSFNKLKRDHDLAYLIELKDKL